MSQLISNLQVTAPKSWAGLTTENALYSAFLNEPQMVSTIVTRVWKQFNQANPFFELINQNTKEMPHDGDYEWFLEGDHRKAIPIVAYYAPDTNRPGVGNTPFRIEVLEQHFQKPDLLWFDDREFQVKIVGDGYANGNNWVYEVEIIEPDPTKFIPPSLLASGRKVSKMYTPIVRTLNKKYNGIAFSSPFKMRNVFSGISKECIVPGNMKNRPLIISITPPGGGPAQNLWTRYQELVMDWEWEQEKVKNLIFSKLTKNMQTGQVVAKGSNGFALFQGAGFRQQIANAYKFYYTTLTLDYLNEVFLNLSINILPEDERRFVMFTGERGMIQFHNLIQNDVQFRQMNVGPDRTFGSGQKMGYGGQYITYKFPQGIIVDVAHFPYYDDPIDARMEDPDGGFTENYRYTIMNIGKTNGEPNVQVVYPKERRETKKYIPGMTDPMNPNSKMSIAVSDVDGYEIKYQAFQGLQLANPFSCCELIKNVSY